MSRYPFGVRASVGVYRAFLLLYPASFTRAFGAPMVQAFRDLLEDATIRGGPFGLLRAWPDVLWDLAVSATVQHRRNGWGRFGHWTVIGFALCLPAVVFWGSVLLDTFLRSQLGHVLVNAQAAFSPLEQAGLWLGLPAVGLVAALLAARLDGRSALSLGCIGVNGLLLVAVLGAATLRAS
jgi:hypothetical protein